MSGKLFDDIPQWIETKILKLLDFHTLLHARVACRRWNETIQPLIGSHAILNIQMDKSRASKRFRRGQWNGDLVCPFPEIRLIPKPVNAFFRGKCKSRRVSALQNYRQVKKFTLFENGSLLHFVHRYFNELTAVKYLQIRERKFTDEETSKVSKYVNVRHAYILAVAPYKSWMRAIENLSQVESLRIRLFDRLASLVYMHLFTFRTTMLTHVELDFSKCYGLPFSRGQQNEIFTTLCDMLEFCFLTLRQLRIKMSIRVDNDLDFMRCDDEIEPFFEFLLCLRNPVWNKVHLQLFTLAFPAINFALSLCETALFPFLQQQLVTLKRVVFSRVVPNEGMEIFAARFPPLHLAKFYFHFYFTEATLTSQPVYAVKGLEMLLLEESTVNFTEVCGTVSRFRRGNAMVGCTQFKLIHSHSNPSYIKPDIQDLVNNFQNVTILELLDTSVYGKLFVHFTSTDFNMIVGSMKRLISLKMSNATKFTDDGLTGISEKKISSMHKNGVFYLPGDVQAPVIEAEELRYLDIRDLPPLVSDASVYFAFRHIKKLEKIAFHGCHKITTWGKQVLQLKFQKNPYFDVIFKSYDDDYVTFGNYTLPCADFP